MSQILHLIVSVENHKCISLVLPVTQNTSTSTSTQTLPSICFCKQDEANGEKCSSKVIKKTLRVRLSCSHTLCFLRELLMSQYYAQAVFNHLFNIKFNSLKDACCVDNVHDAYLRIVLIVNNIEDNVDKAWTHRILHLVRVRAQIEDNLAWLSTLGGAYSCLGEHDQRFAIQAGSISLSQLSLTIIHGDPNLVARCFIFAVYSLCQRRMRKRAYYMMRHIVYPFISKIAHRDLILKNMYIAACYRVKMLNK